MVCDVLKAIASELAEEINRTETMHARASSYVGHRSCERIIVSPKIGYGYTDCYDVVYRLIDNVHLYADRAVVNGFHRSVEVEWARSDALAILRKLIGLPDQQVVVDAPDGGPDLQDRLGV